MHKHFLSFLLALFPLCLPLAGQEKLSSARVIAAGDSLFRAYRFQEALETYLLAGEAVPEEKVEQARNALAMTDYCASPRVVAREKMGREDFFLYYPLPSGAWHPSSNPLDGEDTFPLYLKEGDDVVYFSAPDNAGTRSIFLSEDRDSLWRSPRHPSEYLLSLGSEMFPMVSADGKKLYFSSDGLPGMGGFDLYSSNWDEANAIWGEPENLGIPFNSPYDDFLMADSEDGKYTLFASNRHCGKDSVYVYVIEYDDDPFRTSVREAEALEMLSALEPREASAAAGRSIGTADTRLYMRKMAELRTLRDSLYRWEVDLDALRQRLTQSAEADLAPLRNLVQSRETALDALRQQISATREEVRRIESAFLKKGVSGTADADSSAREEIPFTFEKRPMGNTLKLQVAAAPEEDGTFSIGGEGGFVSDSILPEGIVYQIYLCTSAGHLRTEELRGLAPVYERLNANLRYAYYVGLFPSYQAALRQLNRVRKAGFPEARIVAYSDGRSIPVNQARQEE